MTKKITTLLAIIISGMIFIAPQNKVFAECGATDFDGDVAVSCNNGDIPTYTPCNKDTSKCCSTFAECRQVFPVENIIDGPGDAFFDDINPLVQYSDLATDLSTPGGIVSRLLQFLFPLAALVLFVMLVWGGFEILAKSSQGTKALDAGKNRITAAVVGFILLFATYWMAQIIEAVFGIVIV
jgi:hypothetical protein